MKLSQITLLLLILFSCDNEDESVLPSLETNNPTLVTVNAATLAGMLSVKGTDPISDHGFMWSTIAGVSETTGTLLSLGEKEEDGAFETILDGLNRGKKYYYKAYVKVNDRFFLGNEIEFTAGTHTITSVTPLSLVAGGTFTIVGSGFVSNPTEISVTIGNLNVPVNTSTETQIELTLPVEISGGSKSVKVEIDDVEVSSTSTITITPVIENINMPWGFAGDTVEISGSGFGNMSEVSVKINNQNATVTSANFSKLNFVVPANSGGTNTLSVHVNSVSTSTPVIFSVIAWRKLTDLPFVGRYASSSFIINNNLYIGMGASLANDRFKDFWQVDLQSGVATKLNDFPQGGRFSQHFFSIGDKGYIVLGYDETTTNLNELWEYDPNHDSWTIKSPFPGVIRSGAVSFVLNGKAYLGCGIANGITSLDDVYKYDPELNTWEPVADFGGGPIYGQGSFVIDNKAYLVGGVKDNSTIVRELWEFDGSTWTQRADYPGVLMSDGLGFNYNSLGCFGFGWIDPNNAGIENWKYKPSSNYWKKIENFPGPGRFGAVSGSSEKYWYFGLGYKGNTEYKDIWIAELP